MTEETCHFAAAGWADATLIQRMRHCLKRRSTSFHGVLRGAYRWNAPPERARTFDAVRIAEPSAAYLLGRQCGFGPLGDQPAFLPARQ